MMIEQPNIRNIDLNLIKIPVLLTLGEFDLITRKHTQMILKNIKQSHFKLYQGKDHGGHLITTDELLDDMLNFFRLE